MYNGEPLNHLQFCGQHIKVTHRHQSEGERVTKMHISLREHL